MSICFFINTLFFLSPFINGKQGKDQGFLKIGVLTCTLFQERLFFFFLFFFPASAFQFGLLAGFMLSVRRM